MRYLCSRPIGAGEELPLREVRRQVSLITASEKGVMYPNWGTCSTVIRVRSVPQLGYTTRSGGADLHLGLTQLISPPLIGIKSRTY